MGWEIESYSFLTLDCVQNKYVIVYLTANYLRTTIVLWKKHRNYYIHDHKMAATTRTKEKQKCARSTVWCWIIAWLHFQCYIVLLICSPTTQTNVKLFAYKLEIYLVMQQPTIQKRLVWTLFTILKFGYIGFFMFFFFLLFLLKTLKIWTNSERSQFHFFHALPSW